MGGAVEITLSADGQALTVDAPPVLADAAVNTIHANVTLSEEWSGLVPVLACRNCTTGAVCSAEINSGAAIVPAAALTDAGAIEVAIIAQSGDKRLTTQAVTLPLHESNI